LTAGQAARTRKPQQAPGCVKRAKLFLLGDLIRIGRLFWTERLKRLLS
jgi:hypothetical protein